MKSVLVSTLECAVVALGVIALAGCEEATGPQSLPTGVQIRTTHDVFPVETAGALQSVTITGNVVNDSRWILVVNYCGYSLARGGPAGGADVWTQSCAAVNGVPIEVAPGGDLDFAVTVTETSSFDLDGDGQVYRLRVPMFIKSGVPFGEKAFELEPDARLSNTFLFQGPIVPPGTSPAP
jgi:hypothetical protein